MNGFSAFAGGNEGNGGNQTSVYAGATLNTPVSALKLGASVDYLDTHDPLRASGGDVTDGTVWDGALYASFQATEKLSLNLRGEFVDDSADVLADFGDLVNRGKIWETTVTAQYDLWKNVISRVEFRWDHGDNGKFFGATSPEFGNPSRRNAYMLAAQVIYKF